MNKPYDPVVGPMTLNQPWLGFTAPEYIVALLSYLDSEIARVIFNITDRDDIYESPFGEFGTSFETDTFKIRAHSWSPSLREQWNFKYGKIQIAWYQYLGKGTCINYALRETEAIQMFNDCLKSIRRMDVDINIKYEIEDLKNEFKPAGININQLEEHDKYRPVVYKDEVRPAEFGWISSWNDSNIFVRYHSGDTSAATNPGDLQFIDHKARNR